jgi:hypothetical protein
MMGAIANLGICVVLGVGVGAVLLAMLAPLVMIACSAARSAERGAALWRGGERGGAVKAFIAAMGICVVFVVYFGVYFHVIAYLCMAMPGDAMSALVAFMVVAVMVGADMLHRTSKIE